MVSNDNSSDNVVNFYEYVHSEFNDGLSDEEITDHQMMQDSVFFLAQDISSELSDILWSEGYDLSKDDMIKDYTIIIEMVRAMLYRQHDEDHIFHQFLDSVVVKNAPQT